MSRDTKEYWIANCSFEESDDYQIWMDAVDGKVIYIARYPVGWFSGNEGIKDFMERAAGDVSEQTIHDNAAQYARRQDIRWQNLTHRYSIKKVLPCKSRTAAGQNGKQSIIRRM